MKRFVDRELEMETLQNEYERDGSALVALYGRRRVGKTTLISEFIQDKKALFFLASEEAESQNRNAFQEKAAEFIDSDLLNQRKQRFPWQKPVPQKMSSAERHLKRPFSIVPKTPKKLSLRTIDSQGKLFGVIP